MMTSPTQTRTGAPGAEVDDFDMNQDDFVDGAKKDFNEDVPVATVVTDGDEMIDLYKSNKDARDGLKRSMAKASMKM